MDHTPDNGDNGIAPEADPATLPEALQRIRDLEDQLDKALFDAGNLRLQLDMFSVTDTLTGLRNMNGVITALERAAVRSRRSGEHFALMAVDIPALSRIAADYGRPGFDDTIRHAGALISACLRRLDTVGRMDDAGFHVVLPMLDSIGVAPVVERMAGLLGRMPMDFEGVEVALEPVFTVILSNPHGTNDIQRLVRELATARDRQPTGEPLVIRSKAVVEEPHASD